MESAMTQPEAYKRYRFCGHVFNAWLPAAKRPNDAKLLYHLSQQHPDKIKSYLERMRTEDSGMVVAETYEVVKAWADCHEIAVIHEFVDRLGAPAAGDACYSGGVRLGPRLKTDTGLTWSSPMAGNVTDAHH
jgi:hypothetical protein